MVTNITAWIKEELYPALYPHVPKALPEHSWTEDRRGWRSKTYLDGSPHRDRNDKTKVLKAQPGYIFEEGGEGRSLVDYVMQRDRLPFIDAVRKLSAVAGLQPPSLEVKDQEAYRKVQERTGLIEEATSYMSWSLLNATGKKADAVRKYLQEERGYTMEDVEAMGLGYLPSWEQLRTYLVGKGYQEQAIEEALAIGTDGRLGDTHTLAIPYRTGSRIQGFAFRTVTGAEPKYLNTAGMDRKAGLFNLSPLKGTKDLVVVEGYLDALHATAKGLENVVAASSAHLGMEHIQDAVAKGARAVTLCFDPDHAGRKATDQALEVLRSFPSLKAYVAQLPAGAEKMDPDQLIKEQGVEALRAVIASAIPAWEYELGQLLEPFAQGELQPKEEEELIRRAVVTANDIADPIHRDRFTSAFLFQVEGLGVTKESLDAVAKDLRYQRKREKEKKAVEGLLKAVGKDLDAGEPGAAIDRLGEGLQSLRAVRGADLLHPATYTGWLDRMSTAPPALRTGYASLDAIARIPQAAVTLVAGRPSHGKTLVMYNLLLSMAEVYPNKRFLFFTYEEPSEHILTKLLNSLLGVDLQHLYQEYEEAHTNYAYLKAYLRNGRADVKEVEDAKDKLRGLLDSQRIQVVDGNYSVEDLDGILTGEVKKGPELGAVFLDYIQRMSTTRQTQDKRTEIAHISDQVLQIAKRTGLPLILGAQINRDAVASKGSKPKLDNLKEAGNLEEDANLVLSVYNESREKDPTDGESWGRVVDLELCTLKNRDGEPNAKAVLSFDRWTGVVKDKEQTW